MFFCRRAESVDALDCVIRDLSVPEVRLDMYFDEKGKDFRLLMNLLTETSGLAYSFRFLAMFDKHFQRQWRARDVKIIVEDAGPYQHNNGIGDDDADDDDEGDHLLDDVKDDKRSERRHKCLWVQWNDASIATYMTLVARGSLFEYTVDVSPSADVEAPVKSVLYHSVPDFTACGVFDRQLSVATPNYSSSIKKGKVRIKVRTPPLHDFGVRFNNRS